MTYKEIHIIGGGLAGTEAAWQIIEQGIPVILHEMRPVRKTDVHKTDGLAEMVCSNSFRSDDYENNAVGLLHEEMRRCDSLIMAAAQENTVPAGSALAVDRDGFSASVQEKLEANPLFTMVREEIATIPPEDWDNVIIATGPLTSDALARSILDVTGEDELAFFDAIAPIIYKDSIDFDKVWFQSRYDKAGPGGTGADYINCALDKQQYETFIEDLVSGEKTDFKK
ncbi:MAG: methylenetetrahydrofolate--tRNA-(uracil(54)-C(5))-methyltransferase (FADH(2)-oxidizing) TrmFO, partial [Emcibacter sp.]|nr:methylenetetrahydrofolate--tRNA-(uracil(54)-C(5))-methyltransferase (FADH(2)-oxidizing) TrmFO [Emcibacter sp.]